MTTYNDFGGYGHPDHIRTHDVTVRAFPRAGDVAWYPEQIAPDHGGSGPSLDEGGLAPWTPSKLYEQAIPASVRTAMRERDGGPRTSRTRGHRHPTRRPSSWPSSRPSRPGCSCPTRRSRPGSTSPADPVDQKWEAMQEHVTQIAADSAVHGLRARRMARVLGEGGLHPARVGRRHREARGRPLRRTGLTGRTDGLTGRTGQ